MQKKLGQDTACGYHKACRWLGSGFPASMPDQAIAPRRLKASLGNASQQGLPAGKSPAPPAKV
jgi:hypothetical protein